MSNDRPIGAAMWGGRQLPQPMEVDATPGGTPPTQPADTPYPARVAVKDAVSIGLVTIGDVLVVVGTALAWGGPIAMIVGGVSVLAAGLLIGVAS